MKIMKRHPAWGLRTLAVCETCGRYVDVNLAERGRTVEEFDHRADYHMDRPTQFRPLIHLVDPAGEWAVLIHTTRPTPPGKRLR